MDGCGARKRSIFLASFCFFFILQSALLSQQIDPCHFDYGLWTTRHPMPGTRTAMDAESISGRIYVIGGMTGTDDPAELRHEIWSYDPVSDRWDSTLAPLHVPRALYGNHTCVLGNQLYVIGGTTKPAGEDPGYSARMDVYDPETDHWQSRADLPVPLGSIGVCAFDGQIFVSGGINQDHQPLKSLFRYDPGTDTWHREPDMLSPRYRHSAVAVDGKLYIMGGVNDPLTTAGTKLAEVYDPLTKSWRAISSVPTQICEMASVVIDHDIYLLGGKVTLNSGILNTVLKYKVSADSWRKVDELPGKLCLTAACTDERCIFLLGGTSSREPGIDRIWTFEPSEVVLEKELPDLLMDQDSLVVDLSQYFAHTTAGKIEYNVCDLSDPTVVSTWIYDSLLIIKGIENGEAQIRILAESGGYRAGDSFSITNMFTSSRAPIKRQATFVAFPNPARGNLYLEARNIGGYMVSIHTIDGRLILAKRVTGPLVTLNISRIPAGFYLIRAWNGSFETTEKLIKF